MIWGVRGMDAWPQDTMCTLCAPTDSVIMGVQKSQVSLCVRACVCVSVCKPYPATGDVTTKHDAVIALRTVPQVWVYLSYNRACFQGFFFSFGYTTLFIPEKCSLWFVAEQRVRVVCGRAREIGRAHG